MSSSTSKLVATCAADGFVSVWEGNELASSSSSHPPSPLHSFSPHRGNTTCIRWNHNNQCLASCGMDGYISIQQPSGDLLHRLPARANEHLNSKRTRKQEALRALAFSPGSRYLCSAGDAKIIEVWDMKKQSMIKVYKGHTDPVTSLAFNGGGDILASANVSGSILLHNVVHGKQVGTLTVQGSLSVPYIAFSPLRKSVLASAGDDGSVHVWDVNSRNVLSAFTRKHAGACKSIAFSNVHRLLLSSSGLDGKINFFDMNSRATVKELKCVSPVSFHDFHPDGVTIAAGTMDGQLMLYDLRNADQPVCSIQAHNAAISILQFPTPPRKKKSSSTSDTRSNVSDSSSRSKSSHSKQQEHPQEQQPRPLTDSQASSSNPTAAASSMHNAVDVDARSHPSRAGDLSRAVDPHTRYDEMSSSNNKRSESDERSGRSKSRRRSSESRIVSVDSSHDATGHDSALGDRDRRDLDAPVTRSRRSTTSELPPTGIESSVDGKEKLSAENILALTKVIGSGGSTNSGDKRKSKRSSVVPLLPDTPIVHTHTIDSSRSVPDADRTRARLASATREEPEKEEVEVVTYRMHMQQTERLRAVIQESLEDFRGVMRQDMNNLHVEVLRQFHIQQTEISKLLDTFMERFETLVNEVKTMREEFDDYENYYG